INPVGLNRQAVRVMDEVGIDISDQTSDRIDGDLLSKIDLLITLCGDARENCPVVPVKVEKRHWSLVDPARAEGTEEEVLDQFRIIRDQIQDCVKLLTKE
ncbi:MAG: arsenate reductase, partial [Bacillota bacterium]|nr:arsenate reductase [Bacillota bacterium]